jgi:membrane associated rhomboid family serine protease
MGLADREYYRDESREGFFLQDWSAVATLIAINVAVFLAEKFTESAREGSWLVENLSLHTDLFKHPWNFWQLLTYGFLHDPADIMHLIFNMLGLWFFGRDIEGVYGKKEFYKTYLSLIILSGLFEVVVKASQPGPPLVGASGGVFGIMVLFACHYPRRIIYVWGIFPVPAMVLVGIYVVMEVISTRNWDSGIAHWAHLGGAAFGFLYYRTGWNLFRLWPGKLKMRMPRRGPKLRVHREEHEAEDEPADDYMTTRRLQQRVDQLLAKISASGESSLTEEERQFLADASRRYQQRRR